MGIIDARSRHRAQTAWRRVDRQTYGSAQSRRHGAGCAGGSPERNRSAGSSRVWRRSPIGTLAAFRAAGAQGVEVIPGIGNPGADRIMLFSRLAPVAAVPSACPHVLVRALHGPEGPKYTAVYADAQRTLNTLPTTFDARIRAYLLVARHGHEICKRTNPLCEHCPLRSQCAFANRSRKPQ